jgi:PAS domain-containing protein
MKNVLFTRIRFRILGIVLLAIIPAVVLIWYSAADRKQQISMEIEGNTLRLSRFLASNLERDLSEGEGYLQSVAEVLRAKRMLAGGCSETIQGLTNHLSVYANVGLSGPDGKVLCSGSPANSIVGLSALEWFQKLDSASGFSVGFDFNGGLSPEPSIVLIQPALADSTVTFSRRRYVFAVMQLEWLNQLAESARLPPGSAISVTNRKGDAIARYPDPDKWVGKSRRRIKDLRNLDSAEGTRVTNGIDGVKRLYAFAKVKGKGDLVVNVGVDRDMLLEPANRALRRQLIALGGVALLAILAAWFGADVFLLKQVRILIGATQRLGAGNMGARSGLSYESGELGELAKAFDEMAETLEWRNAQLRESEIERSDFLAKVEEFIDWVPEPFFVLDDDFRIRAANSEAAGLFEAQREGLTGKPFQDLFPEIPIGKAVPVPADSSEPREPRVHRLSSKMPGRGTSDQSVPMEISLSRISLPKQSYVLALLKRPAEPAPEQP